MKIKKTLTKKDFKKVSEGFIESRKNADIFKNYCIGDQIHFDEIDDSGKKTGRWVEVRIEGNGGRMRPKRIGDGGSGSV